MRSQATDKLVGEGPEALVLDLEGCAAVEWELLDTGEILDFRLKKT